MPRRLAAPIALAGVLLFAGCQTLVVVPTSPKPDEAPAPTTPATAVERLVWAWEHRDRAPLEDLLTADFRFHFAPGDTNPPGSFQWPDGAWYRDDELASTRGLFEVGQPPVAAAASVDLQVDSNLVDLPSTRPGEDPRWHRVVATRLLAAIRTPDGDYRVSSIHRFHLVRGDSAKIPQVLIDRGYRPDPGRWWIERWEEDWEPGGGAMRKRPAGWTRAPAAWALGTVKRLYRGDPGPD